MAHSHYRQLRKACRAKDIPLVKELLSKIDSGRGRTYQRAIGLPGMWDLQELTHLVNPALRTNGPEFYRNKRLLEQIGRDIGG